MTVITQDHIDAVVNQVSEHEGLVVIFRNNMPNCRYPLKNGKDAIFLNGKYATDSVDEIKELLLEIGAGNPHLFIDTGELIQEKKLLDPMEALKASIIAEFKAAEAQRAGANFGTSGPQTILNVTSSADVAAAVSGSTSMDTAPVASAKIVVGSKS